MGIIPLPSTFLQDRFPLPSCAKFFFALALYLYFVARPAPKKKKSETHKSIEEAIKDASIEKKEVFVLK